MFKSPSPVGSLQREILKAYLVTRSELHLVRKRQDQNIVVKWHQVASTYGDPMNE